ncbi:hypothetical protein, partial [Psychroserpens burtonensis]
MNTTLYKLMLLLFTVFMFIPKGYSQKNADPGIGILMSPSSVSEGSTGILSATVGNYGNQTIAQNSLRVTISVGGNTEIIGIASGTDTRWNQLSLTTGSANTIKLTNSGGGFNSFDVGSIFLTVRGNVVSDNDVILGNIVYITAQNPELCEGCPSPPLNTSQGNAISSNDNSQTGLAVTCDQQYETVNVDSCTESEAGTVVTTETNDAGCDYEVTTITTWIGQANETVNIDSCIEAEAGTIVTTETNEAGCDYEVTTITTWTGQLDETTNEITCIEAEAGAVTVTMINASGCTYEVTTITTYVGGAGLTINETTCIEAEAGIVLSNETNAEGCDYEVTTITTWIGQADETVNIDS